jgi:hypothetical protein
MGMAGQRKGHDRVDQHGLQPSRESSVGGANGVQGSSRTKAYIHTTGPAGMAMPPMDRNEDDLVLLRPAALPT